MINLTGGVKKHTSPKAVRPDLWHTNRNKVSAKAMLKYNALNYYLNKTFKVKR